MTTAKKGLTTRYTSRILNFVDGKELLKIRKSLALTQEQMAKQIGVRENTVARWERGELRISEPVSRLIRLLAEMRIRPTKKARKEK